MSSEVLKKFGRYVLLDLIARGGMADIYRARLSSADGAGRIIIIKRVQAAFGSNEEFLQMFRSEIRVSMGLSHPNIAQLYDYGEEGKQPYIAMEYVDGRNLRQLLNRFGEMKKPFPIELAVSVMEQAALGLHYAHEFKDRVTGKSLNIVHRDISPQNLLISFDGGVKVIDFGIAKASGTEGTRVGVIKGKPSYLSPEQIDGSPIDGRCDVFALGIVLWELLVGRKLFSGENEIAVLRMIESCDTSVKPPSTFNPNIPRELDMIVLKCLARNKERRFENGLSLQKTLRRFINTNFPDFGLSDISQIMRSSFDREIKDDQDRLRSLNEKAEAILMLESNDFVSTSNSEEVDDPAKRAAFGSGRFDGGTGGFSKNKEDLRGEIAKKLDVVRSETVQIKNSPTGSNRNIPDATVHTRSSPQIRTGSSKTMTRPVNQPPPKSNFGRIAAVLALLAGAGYLYKDQIFSQESVHVPIPTPDELNAEAQAQSVEQTGQDPSAVSGGGVAGTSGENVPNSITLHLLFTSGTEDAKIVVNGKPLNNTDPSLMVDYSKSIHVQVEKPGYLPLVKEVILESMAVAGRTETSLMIELEPRNFGNVNLKTTPSSLVIIRPEESAARSPSSANGNPLQLQAPIDGFRLPAGKYQVAMKNEVLGMSKTILIEVKPGETLNLEEKLIVNP